MSAAAAAGETLLARLADRDFSRFQALLQREAGIWLSTAKRALVAGRLARRLRELQLPDYGAYYERVVKDEAERIRCLDHLTTNETHFFREPHHFQYLTTVLGPRLRAEAEAGRRPRRLRIWSAACSTGEEPLSLAMTLLEALPPGDGWALEVVATDLSTRVLAQAEAALYPLEKSRQIPEAALKAFMLRGTGGSDGLMKAGPEIRAVVRYARLNLAEPEWPGLGLFDLIFCRNVLIYFAPSTKQQVVRHLLSHLTDDGLIFFGHAESLAALDLPLRPVLPTVYARAPCQPPRALPGCLR